MTTKNKVTVNTDGRWICVCGRNYPQAKKSMCGYCGARPEDVGVTHIIPGKAPVTNERNPRSRTLVWRDNMPKVGSRS